MSVNDERCNVILMGIDSRLSCGNRGSDSWFSVSISVWCSMRLAADVLNHLWDFRKAHALDEMVPWACNCVMFMLEKRRRLYWMFTRSGDPRTLMLMLALVIIIQWSRCISRRPEEANTPKVMTNSASDMPKLYRKLVRWAMKRLNQNDWEGRLLLSIHWGFSPPNSNSVNALEEYETL